MEYPIHTMDLYPPIWPSASGDSSYEELSTACHSLSVVIEVIVCG